MRFTWDERKRESNLKDHELDFAQAERVFQGPTVTYEDDRFRYEEQRFVSLGLLNGEPVSVVHTETNEQIRVISFRRATSHEAKFLFQQIETAFPAPAPQKSTEDQADRRTSRARRRPRRKRDRKKGS